MNMITTHTPSSTIPVPVRAILPVTPVREVFVPIGGKVPAVGSEMGLYFQRGGRYQLENIDFSGLHDVIVNLYGDSNKPVPVLVAPSGGNAFSWSSTTERILIEGLAVDAIYTNQTTDAGYAYHNPNGAFGNVKGKHTTIRNGGMLRQSEGICASACQYLTIMNWNQLDPIGMTARCLMIDNCQDLIVDSCSWTNSIFQSTLRASGGAGLGLVRGVFQDCNFGMIVDAAHGRGIPIASTTLRQAQYAQFVDCNWSGGPNSFNTDVADVEVQRDNFVIGGTITGTLLGIHPGCSNLTVTGLTINNQTGSECITENGVSGNIYDSLILNGADCGIKSLAPSKFTYRNIRWTASKPGLPLAKGFLAQAVDGGMNVTA